MLRTHDAKEMMALYQEKRRTVAGARSLQQDKLL